jgi:hypothetical protein
MAVVLAYGCGNVGVQNRAGDRGVVTVDASEYVGAHFSFMKRSTSDQGILGKLIVNLILACTRVELQALALRAEYRIDGAGREL